MERRKRKKYKEDSGDVLGGGEETKESEETKKGEKREVNVWSLPGGRRGGRLWIR